jgi:hypothetical protein
MPWHCCAEFNRVLIPILNPESGIKQKSAFSGAFFVVFAGGFMRDLVRESAGS